MHTITVLYYVQFVLQCKRRVLQCKRHVLQCKRQVKCIDLVQILNFADCQNEPSEKLPLSKVCQNWHHRNRVCRNGNALTYTWQATDKAICRVYLWPTREIITLWWSVTVFYSDIAKNVDVERESRFRERVTSYADCSCDWGGKYTVCYVTICNYSPTPRNRISWDKRVLSR